MLIWQRVAILNLGKLVTETTIEKLIGGQGDFAVQSEPAHRNAALAPVRSQPWGHQARNNTDPDALTPTAPSGTGRRLTPPPSPTPTPAR